MKDVYWPCGTAFLGPTAGRFSSIDLVISDRKFPTTGTQFTFEPKKPIVAKSKDSPTVTPSPQAIPPKKLLKNIFPMLLWTWSLGCMYLEIRG